MSSRKETIERKDRARKLYKQGKTISQIAKQLSRSESRIREYLKDGGVNWYSREQRFRKIA